MEKQILDNIVENLVAAMPVFHRKLINILDEGVSPQLSHYHFAILGMLSKWNALPVSKISERLLISKPQMTAMIEKLVEQGLVSRSSDETDRRIIRISLTPQGRQTLNHALDIIKAGVAQKLSNLNNSDLEIFSSSLRNIVDIGSRLE